MGYSPRGHKESDMTEHAHSSPQWLKHFFMRADNNLFIVDLIFRNIPISFRLLRNTMRHINIGGVNSSILQMRKLRFGAI